MGIRVRLDVVMARKKVGVSELAERIDITTANLSILKNEKAKAIRFSTLEAICRELDCQPGDLLEYCREETDREKQKEKDKKDREIQAERSKPETISQKS